MIPRRNLRDLVADRRGATAVEFALVMIPFMVALFAIIEFGRVMWTREALQSTAAAGARCMGVLNSSCATAGAYDATATTAYVERVAKGWGLTLPDTAVTLDRGASCGGVSGFSSVSLTYAFQTAAPGLLPPLSNGAPITVTACFPNNS
jgi:Flp pilus assembly protein TadG